MPTELYLVKSVRVDISELSLVPSISVYSMMIILCVLVLCTQVNHDVCDVTLSVHPHRASVKDVTRSECGSTSYFYFCVSTQVRVLDKRDTQTHRRTGRGGRGAAAPPQILQSRKVGQMFNI